MKEEPISSEKINTDENPPAANSIEQEMWVSVKETQSQLTENLNFAQIEEQVLASLPEGERQRITATHTRLEERYGDKCEIPYRQAIMKIYNKEVIIWEDTVKFLSVNIELYKDTLEIPNGKDIKNMHYEDFDRSVGVNRWVKQGVLYEDHESYRMVQDAMRKVELEGKFVATQENTFLPILNSFEWSEYQKIQTFQFLTWFIWLIIMSWSKDRDYTHFLDCPRNISDKRILSYVNTDRTGSLLLAKKC